jgi:hypothetical protein
MRYIFISCHLVLVGTLEHVASTTTSLELRNAETSVDPWVGTYGTIDAGLETMRLAWPVLEHRFAVRRPEDLCITVEEETYHKIGPRYPSNLLSRKPVDLLVVEQGHIQRPPSSAAEQNWEALIAATPISKRPRVVIESWGSGADLWEKGPTTKGSQSRWSKLGYTSRCRRVNASHVGGAINQVRLLVARVQDAYAPLWSWKAYPSPPPPARPMGNLLTPPGLVRKSAYCQLEIDSPMDTLDPMPSYPGAWIKTERGHRRLLMEETARGLGVPKEWQLDSDKLSGGTLQRTTSLFHWEFLAASFLPSIARHTPIAVPATGDPTITDTEVDSPRIPFDWRPYFGF